MKRLSMQRYGLSRLGTLRMLVAALCIATLIVGSSPVAADSAYLSARAVSRGAVFSINYRWNSGSDNGSPYVWVCVGANGDAPIPIAAGVSGSQTAEFIAPYGSDERYRTYIFGLYTDIGCTALLDGQTVAVRR